MVLTQNMPPWPAFSVIHSFQTSFFPTQEEIAEFTGMREMGVNFEAILLYKNSELSP